MPLMVYSTNQMRLMHPSPPSRIHCPTNTTWRIQTSNFVSASGFLRNLLTPWICVRHCCWRKMTWNEEYKRHQDQTLTFWSTRCVVICTVVRLDLELRVVSLMLCWQELPQAETKRDGFPTFSLSNTHWLHREGLKPSQGCGWQMISLSREK